MSDVRNITDKPKTDKTLTNEGAAYIPPSSGNAGLKFQDIPPRDYDTDLITKFLDVVFHAGLDDDENVLTWIVKPTRGPAYPTREETLIETLKKTRSPKALYYATAACKPDPSDNRLYHRKALFKSLRVVVLDDIGTKVSIDKIPEDFPPSYIIESSEGNYQYGYVLTEPVDTLSAAEALVQLVYESGYSDEGGKTPVKLVRLPEGVNGKKGEKGPFVSALTSLTDITYTPQEMLDALKIHVRWEDVLEDADAVTKARASKSLGSTPWASVAPKSQAMNGFIDPVLEWLIDKDWVSNDNGGEWVEVKCPWHNNHTDGNKTAGYKPIGRGDDVDRRAFHCFHGHCVSVNDTAMFLQFVASESGIEAGAKDPAAALTTRYVFDKSQNSVWDIKSDVREMKIAMASYAILHPHRVVVQSVDGKAKKVPMTALWTVSPSRVTVAGPAYDPSTTARIIHRKGENYVNLFSIPEWGHGPIDQKQVDTFTQYLEYLIPTDRDRDYFLMWLAAKCQDMSFRGAALVMVANKQGVGRSTLADMIKTLLGGTNVADVPFRDMVGESQFNEWQEKPFVVSEETLSGDASKFFNNYERLKTLVDPRSREITINPKFGLKRSSIAYASYLFLTNHANAIAIPAEDRRFYVMNNAITPAEPAYFTKINKWLEVQDADEMPTWGRSVYRWLQTLTVDIEALTAPPPNTQAKRDMAGASLSDMDYAVVSLMDHWPDPYINGSEVYKVFNNPLLAGPLKFDEDINRKYLKRAVNDASIGFKIVGGVVWDSHNVTNIRPRLLKSRIGSGWSDYIALNDPKAREKLSAHYMVRNIDLASVSSAIYDDLRLDDRI